MKYYLTTPIVPILLIIPSLNAGAQNDIKQPAVISFFLDCEDCDLNFIRQELPFVSFVRDPLIADVHMLVSDSKTGSNGKKYYVNFMGQKQFKGLNFDYEFTSSQSDTEDDVRKMFLKIIKVGILPYYSRTDFLNNLKIDIKESENRKADNLTSDPWNKWVFRLETGGELQKEKSQGEYSVNLNSSAKKVTEEWKTKVEASYEINRENYFDDGEKIINRQNTKEFSADFVKSLTTKWSAGIFGEYLSRTYLNIENRFSGYIGAEYNFFPWNECNRRVLAVRYSTGVEHFDFFQQTIYDKLKETVFSGSLELNLELIQPWGEISTGLEAKNYFHDFSMNRFTLESDISLRLSKNLSAFFQVQSEMVHDQIYLPKGDASLEDILLKRRKLATTYEISNEVGFRFTFGSIYNNVVNERL